MMLGFIGLGKMGAPMARRLIEAGHSLVVHDTDAQAAAPLLERGARTASSPKEVADLAESVFASLPSPDASVAVAMGKSGVIEGARIRRFIDLSTTGPRVARQIFGALAGRNIVQIDCPVSGGVAGARKGTLAVMTSGPRGEIDALRPALDVFGRVFVIGDAPGAAQTMKLLNNLLSATALAATSEAVAMGVKAGLDPAIMIDVINSGTGRNSASLDKFPKAILPGSYDAGFTTGLMVKDVRLCLDEARALGLSMDIAVAVGRLWEAAIAELGPDQDFTRIMQTMEKRAGVTLHPAAAKNEGRQ
jgi:3-hydroxyisobutyrate dehydrogenase-like beta-hydroxyacid dehydrogenase